MNLHQGLTRLSAVWWGFLAVIAIGIGITLIAQQHADVQAGFIAFLCLIPLYVAHRITCWIVAGFFAS